MWLTQSEQKTTGLSGCLGCQSNALADAAPGLADWPTEWFWKQLFRDEYDVVVIQVHQKVETDHYGWSLFPPGRCAGSNIPGLVICFPFDTTEKILNAYTSLVKRGAIIEYDERPLERKYSEVEKPYLPTSWLSLFSSQVPFLTKLSHCIATTAKAAGTTFELVQWHLQAFYQLSATGKISRGFLYLWPLTAMKYAKDRELPPDYEALENTAAALAGAVGDTIGSVGGAVGGAVSWLKWVVPLGLVVWGVSTVSRFVPDEN